MLELGVNDGHTDRLHANTFSGTNISIAYVFNILFCSHPAC